MQSFPEANFENDEHKKTDVDYKVADQFCFLYAMLSAGASSRRCK